MLDTAQDAASRITDLLTDRLGVDAPHPDADLIDAGLIDSLALVTLIVGLEDSFDCQLPLDGFDIDRFRSVRSMVGFLTDAGALPATRPTTGPATNEDDRVDGAWSTPRRS